MEGKSFSEVAHDEKTKEMIGGYVEHSTSTSTGGSRSSASRSSTELTVEAGDLTPSLKLKRKAVVDNFHDNLDKLYASRPADWRAAPGGARGWDPTT